MMSYGNTAESSFTLVRSLSAHSPALLAKIDQVLLARGFGKIVAEDMLTSEHPNARLEAIRELKWLQEYLENAHERADKLSPPESRGRPVVDDDESQTLYNTTSELPRSQHEPAPASSSEIPVSIVPSPQPSPHTPVSPIANGDATITAVPDVIEKEYDHTSEESDSSSSHDESNEANGVVIADSASLSHDTLPAIEPASSAESYADTRISEEEDSDDATAEAASEPIDPLPVLGSLQPKKAALDIEYRQKQRQRHAREREQTLKLQEKLRVRRDGQRMREDLKRRQLVKRKLEERKRRAAKAAAAELTKARKLKKQEAASNNTGEELWCICRQPGYGFMLACANPKCPYEWFHGDCVGMTSAPRARWFCPVCAPERGHFATGSRTQSQGAASKGAASKRSTPLAAVKRAGKRMSNSSGDAVGKAAQSPLSGRPARRTRATAAASAAAAAAATPAKPTARPRARPEATTEPKKQIQEQKPKRLLRKYAAQTSQAAAAVTRQSGRKNGR